eukprot:Platyproteum_vivax@DN7688_c0_g2_i5.p2
MMTGDRAALMEPEKALVKCNPTVMDRQDPPKGSKSTPPISGRSRVEDISSGRSVPEETRTAEEPAETICEESMNESYAKHGKAGTAESENVLHREDTAEEVDVSTVFVHGGFVEGGLEGCVGYQFSMDGHSIDLNVESEKERASASLLEKLDGSEALEEQAEAVPGDKSVTATVLRTLMDTDYPTSAEIHSVAYMVSSEESVAEETHDEDLRTQTQSKQENGKATRIQTASSVESRVEDWW